MTIDEALETIKGKRWIGCQEKYIEAINLMEITMRKYQKIEQIIHDDWIKGVNSGATLNKIEEVLEDGND